MCDGSDRAAWLEARRPVLGASDAKRLIPGADVAKIVAAKLDDSFGGNSFTDRGHEFEPDILAFLGVPESKALIHAPGNAGFAATPDGLDAGRLVGAECKVRHGMIRPAPNAGEWRQLAWQFLCLPELELIRFGTLTLVRDACGGWEPRARDAFTVVDVARDDPRIVEAREGFHPLAERVLAALLLALDVEKEARF